MSDDDQSREQLLEELATLRRRLAELEQTEVRHQQAEESLRDGVSRFTAFIDNFPGQAWVRAEDGVSVYGHPAIQGVRDPHLAGESVRRQETLPRELARHFLAEDLAVLIADRPQEILETSEQEKPEAGERAYQVIRFPFRDHKGRRFVGGIAIDVTERCQAEQALRASERCFRALIENSSDAVSLVGPDGVIRYSSPSTVRVLGYPADEFFGGKILDFIHPDDQATVRQVFELMLATPGEGVPVHFRFRHKDGAWRWLDGKGTNLLAEPNIEAIVCHYRDVTFQEKQAEERRRLLHSLSERVKELTALHQTSRLLQDERLPIPELLARVVELLPAAFQYPEAAAARLCYNGQCVQVGGYEEAPWKIQTSFPTRDGGSGTLEVVYREARPAEDEGPFFAEERHLLDSIAEMLQAHLNRRLAEEALKQSEVRLRRAQEIAHLGSYEWDLTQNDGTFWSVELYRILGLGPAGRPMPIDAFLNQIVHPEDRSAFQEGVSQVVDEGKSFRLEFRIIRPDVREPAKRVRWVRSLGEPLINPDGRRVGLAGTLLDVTERRQLEQQLLQSQKMEAVGRLAGGVAHDFNNLLTVINGFAELLHGRWVDDEPGREMLEQIRAAGGRAASLTHQLLAFSRKTILAPVVLSLNALVGNMERLLRRLIPADIDLAVRLEPDLGPIKADPSQIEQVVMNLVVNARDAMPDGGKLTIETRNIDLDESYVRVRAEVRPGPYALLAVSDTGIGMDEATRAHIFEPFFTTKEMGRGTGLGLAVVFGIIKQSDGHIEVYSEPGKGSTFKVYLPRLGDVPAHPSGEWSPLDLPRGDETILLVEDEPSVRQLGCTILRQCGYTVLEAGDGVEALEVLEQSGERIALLVTDAIMPRMNGGQLAERLQRQDPGLKVLFVSGYTDEAAVRQGVLEPGTSYLQKPFSPAALARKIREVLGDGSR